MARFLPLALLPCMLLWSCNNAEPLHGTVFSPPQPAKRFTLRDQDGMNYTLGQPRSQAAALYFGFTHCKDVCPQTLAKLARARERAGLSPQQMQIVMVSVDPLRDSSAAMRAFFAKLHVQAVGLTGPASQLRPVYNAYGVAVEPQGKDVGHSDYIYLLDKQGRLREVLSPKTALNAVASDLRTLVE